MSFKPAVEIVVLAAPAPEAVAEAPDVEEGPWRHEDDAPDIAGVGQPISPSGHRYCKVKNLLNKYI